MKRRFRIYQTPGQQSFILVIDDRQFTVSLEEWSYAVSHPEGATVASAGGTKEVVFD